MINLNFHFRIVLILIGWVITTVSKAQHGEHHSELDTCSFRTAVCEGKFEGHARMFAMATDNSAGLMDSWALAVGAGIGYETRIYKHFQIGVSGFFTHNLVSSDMDMRDSLTNSLNRYELGLFDIEDPNNKHDLDRLEKLYLRGYWKNGNATLGKQLLNTPFINGQDGRMMPTKENGIWLQQRAGKFKFEGGWIWAISPRSTVNWYKVEDTYGIFPNGVATNGDKSDYEHHISSAGIGIGSVHYRNNGWNIGLWNQYADNVFNTAMIEVKWNNFKDSTQHPLEAGIMYVRQDAINNGENEDQSKTYMDRDAYANVISAFVGYRLNRKYKLSVAYTHITGDGRFLMPRAWGREPFYTFMQRERNEGVGNVHAVVARAERYANKHPFVYALSAGYFQLPDVKNYRLNKYGMPSYVQINGEAKYDLSERIEGLEVSALVVYKMNMGNTYDNPRFIFNKVDVFNYNLVLNYHF